ncbi:MAG: sulfotransferase family 2 domain-containing protein [Sulfurimicrobium sp.]|jgi:hypothetical protein|nr:sulfotransferase family 2 domain-containing protein [Sulfurimicrobium sp.]
MSEKYQNIEKEINRMNEFVHASLLCKTKREKSGSPIVFVHIPKTGGMTFYSMIREIYRPSELHKINPAAESIETYKNLPRARKDRLKAIYGHMDYGLRDLLPADSAYVTLMRHPVERVISHFYYVRRTENDPRHELAMHSSLYDWVANCKLEEMENGQTRKLSGMAAGVKFGECSTEVLAQAKTNIARDFALVGITERYDETYLLMSRIFGWPIKNYPSINVAKWKPGQSEIPAKTLRLIEKFNALDMELYDYATRLFAKKIEDLDIRHEMRLLQERRRSRYLRWQDATTLYVKMKARKWTPAWLQIAS